MQGVIPQPAIAELLKPHFVGLASDCDAPEPAVIDLISEHLADGMMLPFVLVTDSQGAFLWGSHGAMNPDSFKETLLDILG